MLFMSKKRIRTKIEAKFEVIPSLTLAISLCLQIRDLSFLGFSLLLKRLPKVPSLGLKEGIYRLGFGIGWHNMLFSQNRKFGLDVAALGLCFGQPGTVYPRLGAVAPRSRRCGTTGRLLYLILKIPIFTVFDSISAFFQSS